MFYLCTCKAAPKPFWYNISNDYIFYPIGEKVLTECSFSQMCLSPFLTLWLSPQSIELKVGPLGDKDVSQVGVGERREVEELEAAWALNMSHEHIPSRNVFLGQPGDQQREERGDKERPEMWPPWCQRWKPRLTMALKVHQSRQREPF